MNRVDELDYVEKICVMDSLNEETPKEISYCQALCITQGVDTMDEAIDKMTQNGKISKEVIEGIISSELGEL